MVQLFRFLAVAAACLAAAHPGEKHDAHVVKREVHAREAMAAAAKRSLGGCESSLHSRELVKRNVARRSRTVQQLRKKRGITASKLSRLKKDREQTIYIFQFPKNGRAIWLRLRNGRPLTTTRPTPSTTALPPRSQPSSLPTPAAS
jgi:hypothetical protein